MKNAILTKHNQFKQAYATIEQVLQEVVLAEQSSLENICIKLRQENTKVNSPVITQIIDILGDWGKISAHEIKERAINIK
jgi:hypothetical protein